MDAGGEDTAARTRAAHAWASLDLLEPQHELVLLLLATLAQLAVVLLVAAVVLDHLDGIIAQEDLLVVQLLTQGVLEVVALDLLTSQRTQSGAESTGYQKPFQTPASATPTEPWPCLPPTFRVSIFARGLLPSSTDMAMRRDAGTRWRTAIGGARNPQALATRSEALTSARFMAPGGTRTA